MKIVLPDELEEKFREEIFKTKGMKKGNISKSVAEAIKMWIKAKPEQEKEEKEEPEEETESWEIK